MATGSGRTDGPRDKGPGPRFLREAVENVREAFVTINRDQRVVFFNRAAEKMFGVRREDVLGRDLNLILSPACSPDHGRAVARFVEESSGRPLRHEAEFVLTRKDGRKVPVALSFSVSRLEDGLYLTGILRDVSARRALEQRAARQATLAALGRFTAEITHEIRNPLMIIGLNIHQLLVQADSADAPARLRLVEGEVQRLDELLTELGEYYRVRPLSRDRFDAAALLEEICFLARADSEPRGIALDCRLARGPALVLGDRSALKEVLLNLVQNSVEALEGGGHLVIKSRLSDRLEIEVADSGPGIPANAQKRIFTPFFTTKERGSGLGLAISKRIIDSHPGGRISFASRSSGGTIFMVSLPLLPEDRSP
jgi:two-component system sensor kinase FixL